jgi:trans-aconitate 2-methyltransferase
MQVSYLLRLDSIMPDIEWDSEAYDRLSDPQFGWGMKLIESLSLRGDETILDAGCGSGRLTAELLKRLPHGRVVAVDASSNMVKTAKQRLRDELDRVEFLQADLNGFTLPRPVDGIFSNAVFHWVSNHSNMFQSLFAALKPGGWLVAQFGGGGNLSRLKSRVSMMRSEEPFRRYLEKFDEVAHYESVAPTVARMKDAGFTDIEAALHPEPVTFPDAVVYKNFIRSVNLHRYVAKFPPEVEEDFVERLAATASKDDPPYTLNYVRLTIRATKPKA